MENKLKSLYKTVQNKFLYLAAPIVFSALTSCSINKFYVEDDIYYIPEKKVVTKEQIQNKDTLFLSKEDIKNFSDLEIYTSTNKSALSYWSWRFENSPYRSLYGWDSDGDGIINFDDPWRFVYGPYVDTNGNGIVDIMDWQVSGIGNSWIDNYWFYSNHWNMEIDFWILNHQRHNSYRYHIGFPYYSYYSNFFNFSYQSNAPSEKIQNLENVVRRERPSTLTNTIIPSDSRRNLETQRNDTENRRKVPSNYSPSYSEPRMRPSYDNSSSRRTTSSNQSDD